MNRIFRTQILLLIFALAPFSLKANADEPQVFEGTIVAVEGQRLAIESADGAVTWMTTSASVDEEMVGNTISGKYVTGADLPTIIETDSGKK